MRPTNVERYMKGLDWYWIDRVNKDRLSGIRLSVGLAMNWQWICLLGGADLTEL